MLNIYQWFYQNIWPLKNKSILVNYKNWKVIIQAPIGTWKSFLFFDGPLFSLYKSNDRTIINKDSKNWQTQLLFSVDDNYFLVVRNIKLTKTWKDSVKTYLYSIIKDKNFIDYLDTYNKEKIIIKNNDILTLLNFHQVKIENLTSNFKQEKELQENLNDILPPKEVATSTFFIKQDSENIFEVNTSERINILKKIFWIMWIDDAKKIIDEKKRETYWMIKALSAEDTFKDRFKDILKDIKKEYDKLDISFDELEEIFWLEENFDIKLDKIQKLQINLEDTFKKIQKEKEEYIKSNEKYKLLKRNLEEETNELKRFEEKLKEIIKNIEKENKLKNEYEEQENKLNQLKEKLKKINSDIKNIDEKYDNIQKEYEYFLNKVNKLNSEKQHLNDKQTELENNKKVLEKLNKELEKWKDLNFDDILKKIKELEDKNKLEINFEKYHIQDFKPTNLKELETTFKEIITKWKTLTEKIKNLEKQKKEYEENLENFNKQLQNKENATFFCSKIENNCPFIEKIQENFSSKDNISSLIEKTKNNLQEIEKEIKNTEKQRQELVNYWKENKVNDIQKIIENYYKNEEEIKRLNNILHQKQEEQKNFAQKIWEKKAKEEENLKLQNDIKNITKIIKEIEENIDFKIEKDYKNIDKLKKEKENISKNIENTENNLNKLKEEIEKIKEIELEKENIKKQISQKKEKITNLGKELEKISKNIENNNLTNLQEKEQYILKLKENIAYFNNLVDEFNKNKLELIKIKEKYSLLKNLWNIFWRELIIYVFKDYLESLENLINYFLEDVVNFKLFIHLDESWENLEIYIKDEKWKREIQSLSWWQKNALKIWWILWINKLKNSKLLFLDETINNFDEESVHIIANKIKEFISENNIKFYMITHSQTLANLDIWSEKLELEI